MSRLFLRLRNRTKLNLPYYYSRNCHTGLECYRHSDGTKDEISSLYMLRAGTRGRELKYTFKCVTIL